MNRENTELFDVYTINREKTGITLPRGTVLGKEQYRLIAYVCIFNSRNEMLIQQKASFKNEFNIWDFSAGGSSISGETSRDAIQRELMEELGIDYDFSQSKPQLTVYFKQCIDDIYIVRNLNIEQGDFKLQLDEVKDLQWVDEETILYLINQGRFVRYDKNYIKLLFFMNRNGEGCVESSKEEYKYDIGMERCSVCGHVAVTMPVAGKYGSYSYCTCDNCLKRELEPYEMLTYHGGFAKVALKRYPHNMQEKYIKNIRANLEFYNKTDEEFLKDCRQNIEMFKE